MKNYDWTRFKMTVYIKAPIDQIYLAWTTSQGITKWFPKQAHYFSQDNQARHENEMAETGDTFEWEWIGGHHLQGEVLEAKQDQSFKFTFGYPVTVTVNLVKEKDWTCVTILQENIQNTEDGKLNQHLKCRLSWTFYLNNLKAFLELQGDLRDWDASHLQNHLEEGIVSY